MNSTGLGESQEVWTDTFVLTGGQGKAIVDFSGSVSATMIVDRRLNLYYEFGYDSATVSAGGSATLSAGYQALLDGNRIASRVITAPADTTFNSFADPLQGVQVDFGTAFQLTYRFGASALASAASPSDLASCGSALGVPYFGNLATGCSFDIRTTAETNFDLGTIFIPEGSQLTWTSSRKYDVLDSPVSAPVPEPASYALFLLGVATICVAGARRNRNARGLVPIA